MLFLILASCTEYGLNPDGDKPAGGVDTAPVETGETGETGDSAPPPAEVCNGVDDDGDGAVDEGFGDVDADGVADCVDDTCVVETSEAGTVDLSEACAGTTTVTDPWSTVADNVWTGLSTNPSVASIAQTPLVMQLTDDNGDGLVDATDTLDIAFLSWDDHGSASAAHLVVLESGTWREELDVPDRYYAGEIAAGDLDGDGAPEIVAWDGANALHAYELDGTERWATGSLTPYVGGEPSAAIVDLDGDGVAEVLAQESILDGRTGTPLGSLPPRPFSYTQHVVADLDLDGTAEIVYDGEVYAADGSLRWSGLHAGSGLMVQAMVLNVDADAEGEVVMASDADLVVYDTDGAELARARLGTSPASIPCAGDFDGDGVVELAVPAVTALHVLEVDGTEIATLPVSDSSTMAGCAGADLDGDGAVEIVYADETALSIFDARTGAAVVTWKEHASGTLLETPAVVDIDGDGAADVVLGSNDNMGRDVWMGLTVVAHAGAGWAQGPSDWPANARVEGRFDVGGEVIDVGTWWTRENTFRTVSSVAVPLVRDARVTIDDVCLASCDPSGAALVSVRVENPGRSVIPADTVIGLYRVDGGVRTLVASQTLGVDLPSGGSAPSVVFSVTSSAVGSEGFVATVGEGGEDCHPEDDEAAWAEGMDCP